MSTVLYANSASLVGLLVDTVELVGDRTRDLKKPRAVPLGGSGLKGVQTYHTTVLG